MKIKAMDILKYFYKNLDYVFEYEKSFRRDRERDIFENICIYAFGIKSTLDTPYVIRAGDTATIFWDDHGDDEFELEFVKENLQKTYNWLLDCPYGMKVKHEKYYFSCIDDILMHIDDDFKDYKPKEKYSDMIVIDV